MQNSFSHCWRIWKLSVAVEHMYKKALERQDIARKFCSMRIWIAYIVRLRLNPERYLLAVTHCDRKYLRHYFERWLMVLRHWRLGAKEEKVLTGKAIRHFTKYMLRSSYESWQDWLKYYAGPKRKKFAEVQAHINMMTMKQATAAWRCIVYVKWVRRVKFEEATELSKTWNVKRTFSRSSYSYFLCTFPFEVICTYNSFEIIWELSSIIFGYITLGSKAEVVLEAVVVHTSSS